MCLLLQVSQRIAQMAAMATDLVVPTINAHATTELMAIQLGQTLIVQEELAQSSKFNTIFMSLD